MSSAARTSIIRAVVKAPQAAGAIKTGPFLKWAGGKSRLLTTFDHYFPEGFDYGKQRYFEPFIGGGAVFFHLLPKIAVLSDLNPELINCYQVVRDDVEELICQLLEHKNESDYFYHMRSQNPICLSPVQRAARLIYLNKTCFNGLYRVNRNGEFNVPFGRYDNPRICDSTNLRAANAALHKVKLVCAPFAETLKQARRGDFIYLDPPYQPISATSNFTGYTATSFGHKDQESLAQTFRGLSNRGCFVMLSNSDSPFVRDLYSDFRIETAHASRAINCKADRRGRITELIVMNY